MKFDARTLRRTFVIATSDLVEQSLAAGIVKLLSASAPLVDLAFRAVGPDIDELLTSGRADLLFAPKASLPPGTVSQALYDDNFACVVRKGHPRIKTSLSLAAYAAELHIQIAPRGLPGGPVDDALAARGLVRRVAVRTPSFLAAPLFASNSDLLLTAPSRLLASLIEPFGLRVWDVPLPLAPIRLVQGWHPRAHDDAGHKFFRGLVATAARALRDG